MTGAAFLGGGAAFFPGGGAAFFLGGGAAFFLGGGAAFFFTGGGAAFFFGSCGFCARRIKLRIRACARCLVAASSEAENFTAGCMIVWLAGFAPAAPGAGSQIKSAANATPTSFNRAVPWKTARPNTPSVFLPRNKHAGTALPHPNTISPGNQPTYEMLHL
ncbi:hypothetical protein BMS3Bbin10_01704 [bacterium BMS3Bbin10]|nr:hypothetical protein BMS3Bbin10_01704 [bacterium BMS3Bbin10]